MSPPLAPRVSVVIPTYNQADFLREALDSVLAQTMADWEAIVVNNFSADHTRDVVLSYDDPRITLIDYANHGVIAASRNVGIRRATGEWVAFLDSDDWWDARKLEACLDVAEADIDVISHPEQFVRDGQVVHRTAAARPERCTFRSLLLDGNCLSPSAILVRRILLAEAGGFCEAGEVVTAEDAELWLRLASMGARMRAVDQPLTLYRLHGEQNSNSVERHMNASLAVLDRHYSSLEPAAPLAYRRARARIIYAAGRTQQKLGRAGAALRLLGRAFATWPFLPRIPVAVALVLAGAVRRG